MEIEEEIPRSPASEGGLISDEDSDMEHEDFACAITQVLDGASVYGECLSPEEAAIVASLLEAFGIGAIFELLSAMGGWSDDRSGVGETQKWVENLPSSVHSKAFNELRQLILLKGRETIALEDVQRLLQTVYFPALEENLNPLDFSSPSDIRHGLYVITCTPPPCNCLVRPKVKEQLCAVTSKIEQPDMLPYIIGPSEKGGKGMFAARDIKEGELILVERPMVVLPDMLVFLDPNVTPHCEFDQQVNDMLEEYRESILRVILETDPDLKEAFEDLASCRGLKYRLSDIFQTNAMLLTGLVDQERAEVDERGSGHGGVFKDASRLNHSCAPNVKLCFDYEIFAVKLRAAKSIKAGEELLFMYAGSQLDSALDRRMLLQLHWGFICNCERCLASV